MFRLRLETLLALDVDHLRLKPYIPDHWASYKIHDHYRETTYHITVKRVTGEALQIIRDILDGMVINVSDVVDSSRSQGVIPLVDDRWEYFVEVDLI